MTKSKSVFFDETSTGHSPKEIKISECNDNDYSLVVGLIFDTNNINQNSEEIREIYNFVNSNKTGSSQSGNKNHITSLLKPDKKTVLKKVRNLDLEYKIIYNIRKMGNIKPFIELQEKGVKLFNEHAQKQKYKNRDLSRIITTRSDLETFSGVVSTMMSFCHDYGISDVNLYLDNINDPDEFEKQISSAKKIVNSGPINDVYDVSVKNQKTFQDDKLGTVKIEINLPKTQFNIPNTTLHNLKDGDSLYPYILITDIICYDLKEYCDKLLSDNKDAILSDIDNLNRWQFFEKLYGPSSSNGEYVWDL